MMFKKKDFFLLIFLILLQSCSGGRIGNFLESSFNDLEKISQDEKIQKNLANKKIVIENKKDTNLEKTKKIKKVEKLKIVIENKKDTNLEKTKKMKKVEKPKIVIENKKDTNLEKTKKQKNSKVENSSKIRKTDLQSYKIIFILKDVDPKDPTEELSTILSNSKVNFEIEKIERIFDSKNKSMKKIN